jgi:hypothetical protein
MPAGLREQLIGAWKLVSYQLQPVDGSPSFYPMTERASGLILYTSDGFMSVQFMEPDRKPFASGDWFKGTDEEYRQAAPSYVAYAGPFQLDEEKQIITHSLFVSILPNWIGGTQARAVRVEGDDLYLRTVSPLQLRDKKIDAQLHWRRANKS